MINVKQEYSKILLFYLLSLSITYGQGKNHLLVASKTYSPDRSFPAESILEKPINFAIPEEIRLSKGNAGNGELLLQFRLNGEQLVTCRYKGGANSLRPKGKNQILKGERFHLQSIDGPFSAWDMVVADYLKLTIVSGVPQSGPTEVILKLPTYTHSRLKTSASKEQIIARKEALKRNALRANALLSLSNEGSLKALDSEKAPAASAASIRPEVFCASPKTICSSQINIENAYFENPDVSAINYEISCLTSGALNGGWFTFTSKSSGNLNFTITPELYGDDYDWAVFDVTGKTCADIATTESLLIECNNGGPGISGVTGPNGSAGDQFSSPIPVIANNTYMIFVSCYGTTGLPFVPEDPADWAAIQAQGFTINFSASTAIIMSPPPLSVASSNSPVCNGSTLNLSANTVTGATYEWRGPNGFTSTLQNPVISNVSVFNAGTYYLTVTNSACPGVESSTNVAINSVTTPIASNNGPICTGGSLQLSASTVTGASYSWTGPNGFISNQQNPVITNVSSANAGTYQVKAVAGICESPPVSTVVMVNAVTSLVPIIEAVAPVEFVEVPFIGNANFQFRINSVPPLDLTTDNKHVLIIQVFPQVPEPVNGALVADWSNKTEVKIGPYLLGTNPLTVGPYSRSIMEMVDHKDQDKSYFWRAGVQYKLPLNGVQPVTWTPFQVFTVKGRNQNIPADYLFEDGNHSNEINWIYEVTYLDQGKLNQSIAYQDGLGKIRQHQTMLNQTIPVKWTGLVGCVDNGNSLTKTNAGTSWNAGAVSTELLGVGGFMEFTASETNTDKMVGLSNTNPDASNVSIKYAINQAVNGAIYIYEEGINRGAFGFYIPGNTFKIIAESGKVKYYKDNVLLYTSTLSPTFPMMVDASLNTPNATLKNVYISTQPKILAREIVYSEEGGAAIQSMEAPTASPAFGYATNFFDVNKGTNNAPIYEDFKTDHYDREIKGSVNNTLMAPVPVESLRPGSAGYYYSDNNIQESYVDNSNGFPYSYSVAYNDPLGRPMIMGGVGETFKITGGKEIRSFNTASGFEELARVYGKQKADTLKNIFVNILKDPNGVETFTYTDGEGKVIATALSTCSSAPLNQDLLKEDGMSGFTASYNILNNDQIKEEDLGKESSNNIYLSCANTNVNIHYQIDQGTFSIGVDTCQNCEYSLIIRVIEDVTGKVILDKTKKIPSNTMSLNCNAAPVPFVYDTIITLANSGTYTIARTIRANTPTGTNGKNIVEETILNYTNTLLSNLESKKYQFEQEYYSREEWYMIRQLKTGEGRIPEMNTNPSCPEILPKAQITLFNIPNNIVRPVTGSVCNGEYTWLNQSGGSDYQAARKVLIDNNGNVLVSGIFKTGASFGTTTLTSSGNYDIYLAKYNSLGQLIWAKKAGGAGEDIVLGMNIDVNGHTYITGYYTSSIDFSGVNLTGSGSRSAFLAKYNTDGTLLWVKNFANNLRVEGKGVASDVNGNVFVAGLYNGMNLFGSVPASSKALDVFVCKLDRDGNMQWGQQIGDTPNELPEDLALDNYGNTYITGMCLLNSTTDAFIAKLDKLGNQVLFKRVYGSNLTSTNGMGGGIVVDKNGNFYISGSFQHPATFENQLIPLTYPGTDVYIAKYNPLGGLTWLRTYRSEGASQDIVHDIVLTRQNELFITGLYEGQSGFIVSYDADGRLLNEKILRGGYREPWSIAFDKYENKYIAGAIFNGSSSYDIWLAKICDSPAAGTCTSLSTLSDYATVTFTANPPTDTTDVPIILGTATWSKGMSTEEFVTSLVTAANAGPHGFSVNNDKGPGYPGEKLTTLNLTAPIGSGRRFNNWQIIPSIIYTSGVDANCFKIVLKDNIPFKGGFNTGQCGESQWYLDQLTINSLTDNVRELADLDGRQTGTPGFREKYTVNALGTPTASDAATKFRFVDSYERMNWVQLKEADIISMETYSPSGLATVPVLNADKTLSSESAPYTLIKVKYKGPKCEDFCTPKEQPKNCPNDCEEKYKSLEAEVLDAYNDIVNFSTQYPSVTFNYLATTNTLQQLIDKYYPFPNTVDFMNLQSSFYDADQIGVNRPSVTSLFNAYDVAKQTLSAFDIQACMRICNGDMGTNEICLTCNAEYNSCVYDNITQLNKGFEYFIDKWESHPSGTPQYPYSSIDELQTVIAGTSPVQYEANEDEKDKLGSILYNYLIANFRSPTDLNKIIWIDELGGACSNCIPPGSSAYECIPGKGHDVSRMPNKLLGLLQVANTKCVTDYNDCFIKVSDLEAYICQQNRNNCIASLDPASSTYEEELANCKNTYDCTLSTSGTTDIQRRNLITETVQKLYINPDTIDTKVNELLSLTANIPLKDLPGYLLAYETSEYCKLQCRNDFQIAFKQWLDAKIDSATLAITNSFTTQCFNKNEKMTVSYTRSLYHYTLFEYNRAGQVIATVPPDGIDYINIQDGNASNSNRKPNHRMRTLYTSNSLGELATAITPDAGEMQYLYDIAGRVRFSQNAEQRERGTAQSKVIFSYTKYEQETSRILEVGEYSSAADDGGQGFIKPPGGTGTYASDMVDNPAWPTDVARTFEESYFYYDLPTVADITALGGQGIVLENLHQRVYKVGNSSSNTYYSYDKHGRAKLVVQELLDMSVAAQRFKSIEYRYQPLTSQIREVVYQKGRPAEDFRHRYTYDGDDRLIKVEVSRDSINWAKVANYEYYTHGPLKSIGYGDDVQRLNYVYNLQGWLKSINHPLQANDPGQDGLAGSPYGKDVFALTLHYFSGDYQRAGKGLDAAASITPQANTHIKAKGKDLFNGNISAITSYSGFDQSGASSVPSLLGQGYRYDILNRLVGSYADTKATSGFTTWSNLTTASTNIFQEIMKYDASGNIDTLIRTNGLGTASMDNMYYKYTTAADFYGKQKKTNNKLQYIQDAIDAAGIDDITNQNPGNYVYDAKGRLITDLTNEIQTIKWTAYDKVAEVIRATGSTKPNLKFTYDASGKRVSKTVLRPGQNEEVTYYFYDATGNTMAAYQKTGGSSFTYTLAEQHIYGTGRIGMYENGSIVHGAGTPTTTLSKSLLRFELTDHLGNVRAVVTGVKPTTTTASIVSLRDYYPFGMEMPGRKYTGDSYRYGFNGKEKDEEWNGEGNMYDYGFRMHDPRIGRFFSVDPVFYDYPFWTPYQYASNSPIVAIDLDGLEAVVVITGRVVGLGEASSKKGQYFMYQVKIYENMTLEEYNEAYSNGTLKSPDEITEVARDGWYTDYTHSSKRYGTNNETPPGTYWLTYKSSGYGEKKHRLKISDTKDGDFINGPDGKRTGIRLHRYNPHFAVGCITLGNNDIQSEDDFMSLAPSLKDGKDVRLIIKERDAVYNSKLKRFEGNIVPPNLPAFDGTKFIKSILERDLLRVNINLMNKLQKTKPQPKKGNRGGPRYSGSSNNSIPSK